MAIKIVKNEPASLHELNSAPAGGTVKVQSLPTARNSVIATHDNRDVTQDARIEQLEARVAALEKALQHYTQKTQSRAEYMREYRKRKKV